MIKLNYLLDAVVQKSHATFFPKKTLLACTVWLMGIAAASAEESMRINFQGVEIARVVEVVSATTGKNFVIDPSVRGTVTFISGKSVSKRELYDTFLSILQVHGFDAVEAGNVIKIVPAGKARQQIAPVVKDAAESTLEEMVTEVVKLNYIQAPTAYATLMPLVGSGGGDTRVQQNQSSNAIVITGRAQNVQRIREILANLDQPNSDGFELVSLQYAVATDVANTLKDLMSTSAQGLAAGVPNTGKVSAEVRTNSVLIAGDKATRERLKAAIEKLDVKKVSEGDTRVIQLRYAKAEDVVTVLNGVSPALQQQVAATSAKELKPTSSASSTTTANVNGVTVLADKASNSIIISGPPTLQKNMMQVINQLDRRRAQVMVEAVVAEVSTDLSTKIGAGLVANGLQNAASGIVGASNFGGVGALASAITTKSIPNGFLMGGGSDSFAAIMEALKGDAATNILSTPTLVTLDNEEAQIIVGQEVPFKTGQSTTAGDGTTNPFTTIERRDVGLSFKITPQINRGQTVNLKIEQENSNVSSATVQGASDLITNKRKIATNVMVEDGQILILGGLIEDNFQDAESKVPVLGDVPIIGGAFRNNTTSKVKRNLMVFIHPIILPDGLSADAYTRQKYQNLQQYQATSEVTQRGNTRTGIGALPNFENATNSLDALHTEPARPQRRTTRTPAASGCHSADPLCNGAL